MLTDPPAGPAKRVTLDAVAKAAGLGRTTVSDILNRGASSNYAPETQQRVRDAVQRLGYIPSRAAQTMARGRSGLIGLLLTRDFSNPFWARFADAVEKKVRSAGYLLHLGVSCGDPGDEAQHIRRLMADGVEGLIIGPIYEQRDLDEHAALVGSSLPTVVYGKPLGTLDAVTSNDLHNGRLLGQHLLQLGHQRLALLGDPSSDRQAFLENRFGGIADAYSDAGLDIPRDWHIPQPDLGRPEDAYQTAAHFAQRFLATDPADRPTAVACHNDQFALASLCAFHEAGIRVPHDLALTGYDNLPESRFTVPPLTTVDSRIDQIIEHGVELLAKRISHPDQPFDTVEVVGDLVIRSSTENRS